MLGERDEEMRILRKARTEEKKALAGTCYILYCHRIGLLCTTMVNMSYPPLNVILGTYRLIEMERTGNVELKVEQEE